MRISMIRENEKWVVSVVICYSLKLSGSLYKYSRLEMSVLSSIQLSLPRQHYNLRGNFRFSGSVCHFSRESWIPFQFHREIFAVCSFLFTRNLGYSSCCSCAVVWLCFQILSFTFYNHWFDFFMGFNSPLWFV